ncbi:hypothetical protein PR003_g33902 [Phytophthora rubi]|uniref:Ubiquitin-like protease family profile domain-containing protein n=1 Tax=Phytophthora rubi TaxID=129364 RepID=A0A6A4AP27_9STRA|nr:hypothetical protein PR003_g33902 [Phytophthora rubi]
MLVSLLALRDDYTDVGVISPSYHEFLLPEQRRRVAGGLGASDPRYKRVVGVINLEFHWVAYYIDRQQQVCYMFDPLQKPRNYKILEKSVRSVIELILGLKDMLHFEKIEWCTQDDGTSYGIWCLAFVEMMLTDSMWDDCIYKLKSYLRMRYLHKAIAFVGKTTL